MIRSPDGDTNFLEIGSGFLQEQILTPGLSYSK